jgi:TPR repeat protein
MNEKDSDFYKTIVFILSIVIIIGYILIYVDHNSIVYMLVISVMFLLGLNLLFVIFLFGICIIIDILYFIINLLGPKNINNKNKIFDNKITGNLYKLNKEKAPKYKYIKNNYENPIVGIYKITNIVNSKVYIGESINMVERWKKHFIDLNKGNHHNYKLQLDFNKQKVTDFNPKLIKVLEYTTYEDTKIRLLKEEKNQIALEKANGKEVYNYDCSENNNEREFVSYFNTSKFKPNTVSPQIDNYNNKNEDSNADDLFNESEISSFQNYDDKICFYFSEIKQAVIKNESLWNIYIKYTTYEEQEYVSFEKFREICKKLYAKEKENFIESNFNDNMDYCESTTQIPINTTSNKKYWFGGGFIIMVLCIVTNCSSPKPVVTEQFQDLDYYSKGLNYYNGYRVERNYDKAIENFSLAAQMGDRNAQEQLGIIYYNGEVVKQDMQIAIYWLSLAAKQGSLNAQKILGDVYLNGQKIEQDYNQAFKWLKLAADQGDSSSQFNIGYMYYSGNGIAVDYQEAFRWTQVAALHGSPEASSNLAEFYEKGIGISKNDFQALKWASIATLQGRNNADLERIKNNLTAIANESDIAEINKEAQVCIESQFVRCL